MTDDGARVVLLSVNPRFAEAILAGAKTIELRRTRTHAPTRSHVLLYSTTPTRAIVGTAVLERTEHDTPQNLWRKVHRAAGLGRVEYDDYFAGATTAFAWHLSEPRRLAEPIDLATIRSLTGLEPPQSFRYLSAAQAAQLAPSLTATRVAAEEVTCSE